MAKAGVLCIELCIMKDIFLTLMENGRTAIHRLEALQLKLNCKCVSRIKCMLFTL